jgi:hypothetical protein
MRARNAAVVLFGAVGIASCGEQSTSPRLSAAAEPELQRFERGTGLSLHDLTQTPIPLVGDLAFDGDLVITQLALDPLGGIDAIGTLNGTVTGPGGFEVVNEEFVADLGISRTGPGNGCSLVELDLGPLNVAVPELAGVNLDPVTLRAGASGPVGPLLCALTKVVGSTAGGALDAILGVLNGLLGGGGAPPVP